MKDYFPPFIRNKARMFSLTIPIQHCTRTLSRISQGKEIEGIQIGKQEIKVSFFTDNITDCVETPQRVYK